MLHGSFIIHDGRKTQERVKMALTGIALSIESRHDPVADALAVLRQYISYPPADTALAVYETLVKQDTLPEGAEKRVHLIMAVFYTVARRIDSGLA